MAGWRDHISGQDVFRLCLDELFVSFIRGRPEEAWERRRGRKRARRWVVERTHAWLNRSRWLLVRWERKVASDAAFLHLACALICDRAASASARSGVRR